MKGRIIKGIGGFYTVVAADHSIHVLKAAGRFRNTRETPLVGDLILFDPEEDGLFTRILLRKNELRRPRIANVDVLFSLVSGKDPQPDFLLLDKLMILAGQAGMENIPILNKSDLVTEEERRIFLNEYACFSPFCTSAVTGEGMDTLVQRAKDRVCCFSGQSGVGKSSVAGLFFPDRDLEAGELSLKRRRGKHTTRHAELLPFGEGFLVDTPGFSMMELPLMEPEVLQYQYPEFASYETGCRFLGCLHHQEPDCAVKQAVAEEQIPQGRWKRYTILLEEMQEKWRRRYE